MQISFIILFMIDLYKDNHVRACVHACMCAFVNFSFKKTSPKKLLTGLLPNFTVVRVLRGADFRVHIRINIELYARLSAVRVQGTHKI